MRPIPLAVLIVCLSALPSPSTGRGTATEEFGPWSSDARHPIPKSPAGFIPPLVKPLAEPECGTFGLSFLLWSELLTHIDGPRCAHRPTCAVYASRALRRHGLFLGLWMALDRLMRGAHSSSLRTLAREAHPEGVFFVDSLDEGSFWKSNYLPMSGR